MSDEITRIQKTCDERRQKLMDRLDTIHEQSAYMTALTDLINFNRTRVSKLVLPYVPKTDSTVMVSHAADTQLSLPFGILRTSQSGGLFCHKVPDGSGVSFLFRYIHASRYLVLDFFENSVSLLK